MIYMIYRIYMIYIICIVNMIYMICLRCANFSKPILSLQRGKAQMLKRENARMKKLTLYLQWEPKGAPASVGLRKQLS